MPTSHDNTELPAQSGGDKIRDVARVQDDLTIVKTQAVIPDFGGEDLEKLPNGAHHPVPVHDARTYGELVKIRLMFALICARLDIDVPDDFFKT